MPKVELEKIECPGCGGYPGEKLTECGYCGNKLRVTFLNNKVEMVPAGKAELVKGRDFAFETGLIARLAEGLARRDDLRLVVTETKIESDRRRGMRFYCAREGGQLVEIGLLKLPSQADRSYWLENKQYYDDPISRSHKWAHFESEVPIGGGSAKPAEMVYNVGLTGTAFEGVDELLDCPESEVAQVVGAMIRWAPIDAKRENGRITH